MGQADHPPTGARALGRLQRPHFPKIKSSCNALKCQAALQLEVEGASPFLVIAANTAGEGVAVRRGNMDGAGLFERRSSKFTSRLRGRNFRNSFLLKRIKPWVVPK